MTDKKGKLASRIRAFKRQIKADIEFKKGIYSRYAEELIAITQFEHEAWLLCATADERRSMQNRRRKLQKSLAYEIAGDRLKSSVVSTLDKWVVKSSESELIDEEDAYSFWLGEEKLNAETLLIRLKEIIDSPQKQTVAKAAVLCRNEFIRRLFVGIDEELYNNSTINHFLKNHELALKSETIAPPEWVNVKPMKNKPGRRSLPAEKIVKIIRCLADKFLKNSQKYCAVGQTLLIVWCALSVANLGRRICSVANILALRKESICFKSSGLGCTYQIILKNRSVPISKSLYEMLWGLLDLREGNPELFSVDRSTIENHLEEAVLGLGYDPDLSPITPETFLERPIECGLDDE